MNRPTYKDANEFDLIRSIYFEKDLPKEEQIDQLERLERMESRHRNLNYNSR